MYVCVHLKRRRRKRRLQKTSRRLLSFSLVIIIEKKSKGGKKALFLSIFFHATMKSYHSVPLSSDHQTRSCIWSLFITLSLASTTFFIASAWLGKDSLTMQLSRGIEVNHTEIYTENVKCEEPTVLNIRVDKAEEDETQLEKCNDECRPVGTEALPKGILSSTSNLEMYPLSGPVSEDSNSKHRTSLLVMAVGFKQKGFVNEIVKKFLKEDFVVMLFHYDGVVDLWRELEWSDSVIHVSATNQTKWWFAKRFLHPDIVAEYDYIFLWDEDLGVENFHPGRYLSIIKEEGFEISQPALDPHNSEVHHRITILNRRSRVHRRYYRLSSGGSGRCDGNSKAPPCVGWVEMMAPVFSRAAWRCAWYMVQNDLIHAWGLDKQLGYCAQGDRTVKVGVVDQEYLIHLALPTLGSVSDKTKTNSESSDQILEKTSSGSYKLNSRSEIRQRSYAEMRVFNNRWKRAVENDQCWVDPFKTNAD